MTSTRLLYFDQQQMVKPTLPLAVAWNSSSQPILTRANFIIDTGNSLFATINKETYLKLGRPPFKKDGVSIRTAKGITEIPVFDCTMILETLDTDYTFDCEIGLLTTLSVNLVGSLALEAICQKTDTDLIFNYRRRRVELG
jgi:hypothetical protein